jgi:predicted NUDIX family NTP pyrophosphohydrolase
LLQVVTAAKEILLSNKQHAARAVNTYPAMAQKSAGILLFRLRNKTLEFLLVHPGGPYWVNKDLGAWSIPKGEFEALEEPLQAALREVYEELGICVSGDFIPLTPLKQKSGKAIYAWALEYEIDPAAIRSNTVELNWPSGSGSKIQFPEVDKAAWFTIDEARQKINPGQFGFIKELTEKIRAR